MYSALDLETKDHLFVLDLNENKKTVMFCYNQSGRIHNTIIYYEQFLISNKHTDTVKEGLRLCQNNFESLVVASQGNTAEQCNVFRIMQITTIQLFHGHKQDIQ